MFSPQQIKQFKEICSSFGIDLTKQMIDKFETYAGLLLEWNKRIHLVSKKDATGDRIIRHFVDSLSIFKAIDIPRDIRIIDLGTGAGFPSIPIKIVISDVQLTLVESVHKKSLYLQKLSEILGLKKVSILNQRAEKLIDGDILRSKFDLVTAKALGRLEDTIKIGMPFLKIGGLLVAYKGYGVKKEIEENNLLRNNQLKDLAKIEIPDMNLFRWLVVLEKSNI